MTKIIQISDPHIVAQGELAYGQVDTAKALKKCVQRILKILPEIGPIDMIIFTGDLTDFGKEKEYLLFREIVEELNIPYRAIPGNHDNKLVMQKIFSNEDCKGCCLKNLLRNEACFCERKPILFWLQQLLRAATAPLSQQPRRGSLRGAYVGPCASTARYGFCWDHRRALHKCSAAASSRVKGRHRGSRGRHGAL